MKDFIYIFSDISFYLLGHERKKRGVDHGYKHEDKQRVYYGAAPTQQYETTGFGMAGQDPYYSKMVSFSFSSSAMIDLSDQVF